MLYRKEELFFVFLFFVHVEFEMFAAVGAIHFALFQHFFVDADDVAAGGAFYFVEFVIIIAAIATAVAEIVIFIDEFFKLVKVFVDAINVFFNSSKVFINFVSLEEF
mgnify:CR=1 FL=1